MRNEDNDVKDFWLRKSKKPVLSVLLVQKGDQVKLYRGTNMEVSMPTGSLCAERNVIGSALADDLTLKRHHLKYIAVLSLSLEGPTREEVSSSVSRIIESSVDGSTDDYDVGCSCVDDRGDELVNLPDLTPRPPAASTLSPDNLVRPARLDTMHSPDVPPPPSNTPPTSTSSKFDIVGRPPMSPQRVVNITSLKGGDSSPKRIVHRTGSSSGQKQLPTVTEIAPGMRSLVSFSTLHEPPTEHAVLVDER